MSALDTYTPRHTPAVLAARYIADAWAPWPSRAATSEVPPPPPYGVPATPRPPSATGDKAVCGCTVLRLHGTAANGRMCVTRIRLDGVCTWQQLCFAIAAERARFWGADS